ncbi:hypothetical protein [Streptomyces sp. NPDC056160]|uniref:hypothetical protein n=1 Tax=Streptomyces sp. NPDC056160 TaxID=3345731 RepID=UPI0035DCAC84
MGNKLLRSVLVAAFSAVVALGALSGIHGAKSDVQANSTWPSVAVNSTTSGNGAAATDGAGS